MSLMEGISMEVPNSEEILFSESFTPSDFDRVCCLCLA